MIRVSSMRSRIPNLRRGAACALSLAFLAGVPLAAPVQAQTQTTYTLPAVLPADSAGREGFLRIVNRSFQSGDVRIHAFDDTGERFGPITLALDAEEAVHLTSRDLERGSTAKGLPVGLGNGSGWWRLVLETDLALTPLAYVRTVDGFHTSMHDVVPMAEGAHRVPFFNPGSNTSKVSHLRIINPGTTEAEVTVTGRDDVGDPASGTVQLTLPAGGARTLTAQALEAGGEGFDGSLGDGAGKWRLTVTASRAIEVMSLLQNRTGHLANVSTAPETAESGLLTLPLVLPAADGASREGFLRIVNRSGQAGTVAVTAIDDTGERFGPVTLALDAYEAVHLTSRDLERGSAGIGLPVGVGDGEGSWRLELDSALDVVALGYIRTSDGFHTSMHDVVPVSAGAHRVPFFNPGSNTSKVSHLRIINPGTTEAEVTVTGRDDRGDEASGTVQLTLPAGGARTLTAQALEAGGEGFDGSLGDGAGKWRLTVTASRAIEVMSLLQSRTGHLSNVSTEPEMPPEGNPVAPPDAVPLVLSDGAITGELESPEDVSYYRVTSADEPMILDLSASSEEGVVITVFDERGNMIAQSTPREAAAAHGDIDYIAPILIVGAHIVIRLGVAYTVRIAATSAARTVIAGKVAYQLTKVVTRLALRKVREFAKGSRIVYGAHSTSVDLSQSFEVEAGVIESQVFSIAPVSVETLYGSLSLLSFDVNKRMRVGHRPNDECGTGGDYSLEVSIKLALSWNQRIPPPGFSIPIIDFGEVPLTIIRPGAPRRKTDTAESIAVSAVTGASETVTLTDYIEDPDGGALTFSVSGVPSGWGVTTDGAVLTVTPADGAESGEMTVTATDEARECWNFPVQLQSGAGEWECDAGGRVSSDVYGCDCFDHSRESYGFGPDWPESPLASCPSAFDRCYLYTGGYRGYVHQNFAGNCSCYDGDPGIFDTNPEYFRRVDSCPPQRGSSPPTMFGAIVAEVWRDCEWHGGYSTNVSNHFSTIRGRKAALARAREDLYRSFPRGYCMGLPPDWSASVSFSRCGALASGERYSDGLFDLVVGVGETREAAEQNAIYICSGIGSGTFDRCRVAVASDGTRFSFCNSGYAATSQPQ